MALLHPAICSTHGTSGLPVHLASASVCACASPAESASTSGRTKRIILQEGIGEPLRAIMDDRLFRHLSATLVADAEPFVQYDAQRFPSERSRWRSRNALSSSEQQITGGHPCRSCWVRASIAIAWSRTGQNCPTAGICATSPPLLSTAR